MKYFLASLILLLFQPSIAQTDYSTWIGNWKGQIEDPAALAFEIKVQRLSSPQYRISLHNHTAKLFESEASIGDDYFLNAALGPLSFRAKCDDKGKLLYAILRGEGMYEYVLPLSQTGDSWTAPWLPWHTAVLSPPSVYLAIEGEDTSVPQIYPFFDDRRFAGTYAGDFQANEMGGVSFSDFNSGVGFRASLTDKKITLKWLIEDQVLTQAVLTPFDGNFPVGGEYDAYDQDPFQPKGYGPAFPAGANPKLDRAPLLKMAADIEAKTLTFTDAVLIAQDGKLIYENYFNGYGPETPHQLRSAQKSISAALTGIAIADGHLANVEAKLIDHLPSPYQALMQDDERKAEISLYDLLTMSSGLDAIDFGINRTSPGSEDQYQSTPDWTQTILAVPMINTPGVEANYSSANPALVGEMLREATGQNLSNYQHEKLLAPMGIDNYAIFMTPSQNLYFAGGMLMCPKDMLKFGQLYLNQGVWQGQQLLPKSWIKACTQNYLPLVNTNDKNGYGYYWWHHSYKVKDQTIHSVEARGAGGQYIIVVEELDLVVAITSANFRNGRFFQPEIIMRDYILPAIL